MTIQDASKNNKIIIQNLQKFDINLTNLCNITLWWNQKRFYILPQKNDFNIWKNYIREKKTKQ